MTAAQAQLQRRPLAVPAVSGLRKLHAGQALQWLLRISVAGEFIGHGWVGTSRPAAWLPYFRLFHFPDSYSHQFMPFLGSWDILIGILILVLPLRALLLWTTFWGVFTALLRPAAGEGWWQFVERGGNYGPPLALLLLAGFGERWNSLRTWLTPIPARPVLTRAKANLIAWILSVSIALLLIGHGGIGVFNHPAWAKYFHLFGISKQTVAQKSLISITGWCEIAAGIAVLVVACGAVRLAISHRKVPAAAVASLVYGFCVLIGAEFVWKVGTEILRPISGEHYGQFVERFGDYLAPIALIFLLSILLRRPDRADLDVVAADAVPSVAGGEPSTD